MSSLLFSYVLLSSWLHNTNTPNDWKLFKSEDDIVHDGDFSLPSSPSYSSTKSGANKKTKLKKHPDAPRRFKSAFIFFSTEKHQEIRNSITKASEVKVCIVDMYFYCVMYLKSNALRWSLVMSHVSHQPACWLSVSFTGYHKINRQRRLQRWFPRHGKIWAPRSAQLGKTKLKMIEPGKQFVLRFVAVAQIMVMRAYLWMMNDGDRNNRLTHITITYPFKYCDVFLSSLLILVVTNMRKPCTRDPGKKSLAEKESQKIKIETL